jgi:hypothetical protein
VDLLKLQVFDYKNVSIFVFSEFEACGALPKMYTEASPETLGHCHYVFADHMSGMLDSVN